MRKGKQSGTVHSGFSGSMLRRLMLGSGSVGLTQVITASQAILLVPLFLHAWGKDTYGHWLALTALISYLSLLDLGGQSYIGNLLTMSWATGDVDGFQRRMSEGVSLFIAIAFVALVCLAVFIYLVSPHLWEGRSGPFAMHGAGLIVLFSAISLLVAIPGGVYVTVYRSLGLLPRGTMLGNGLRSTELVLYATLLLVHASPVLYAASLAAASIIRLVVISWDIRAHTTAPPVHVHPVLAWRGRRLLGGALLFWLMAISTAINQQGLVLVVAAVSGSTAVATFSTHRTAAGLIGYVSTLTLAPLWPEFSRLWANERFADVRRLALLAVRVVLLASGLAAILLWVGLPVLYPIWTGRQLHLQTGLLAVFMIQSVLAAGWSTTGWSLLAANRQRAPALWALANALITVSLSVWWGYRWGVMGVASGSLAGDVLCGLAVYPVMASRFLKVSLAVPYLAILVPASWVLLLAGAIVLSSHAFTGWLFVVSSMVVAGIWLGPAIRFSLGRSNWQQLLIALRWKLLPTIRSSGEHAPAGLAE